MVLIMGPDNLRDEERASFFDFQSTHRLYYLYLHLKKCELRFNYRRNSIYGIRLK